MPKSVTGKSRLILGGSFNPVHHGHLICARAVAEKTGATTVVLMPTARAPHKIETAAAAEADRLEMCRLAARSSTGFEVDDREIRRGGRSFTIDTVRQLRSEGCETIHWIIGADMLNILSSWREPEALLREVNFLIVARPGWEFDFTRLPKDFQKLKANVIEAPRIDISATDIRRRVANGLSIDFLTPPDVCRYIREKQLYAKSKERDGR